MENCQWVLTFMSCKHNYKTFAKIHLSSKQGLSTLMHLQHDDSENIKTNCVNTVQRISKQIEEHF